MSAGPGPARSARAAALGLAALMLLAGGCNREAQRVVIYPEADPGARLNLSPAMVTQVTQVDNFVLRPDEFSGVVVDPGRRLVYVGTRAGTLLAVKMEDGVIAWELEFPGALSGEGVLAEEGALLLFGTDNGDLIALDLETRKPRWTYETQGTIRNMPLVVEGVVYVVNSRDQVFALDLRTGDWRWQYDQPYPTDFTIHGHAGLSFQPAEVEPGAGSEGTLSDEVTGTLFTGFSNGKVAAIGASSGEALWLANVAPPDGGDFADADATPLVNVGRGEVVVAGQNTGVHGLALADGSQRWFHAVRGAGTVVRGPRGLMAFTSALEGIFVLEHSGRVRWRRQANPGFMATPLVVGDVLFITHSEDGLLAYDIETGEYLGGLDTGSGISGPPVADTVFGRFYVLTNRGALVSFRMSAP